MNFLTLDSIKKHLNIDEYFHDDDAYLVDLGTVAELAVERHICYSLITLAEKHGGKLPQPIIHAMLLMVGTFYQNRESVAFASSSPIPLAYEYLIALYQYHGPEDKINTIHD